MVGYWRASGPIAPDAPPAYVACTPERSVSHSQDSLERGWRVGRSLKWDGVGVWRTIAELLTSTVVIAKPCNTKQMSYAQVPDTSQMVRRKGVALTERAEVSTSVPDMPNAPSPMRLTHILSGHAILAPIMRGMPKPRWVVLPQPM